MDGLVLWALSFVVGGCLEGFAAAGGSAEGERTLMISFVMGSSQSLGTPPSFSQTFRKMFSKLNSDSMSLYDWRSRSKSTKFKLSFFWIQDLNMSLVSLGINICSFISLMIKCKYLMYSTVDCKIVNLCIMVELSKLPSFKPVRMLSLHAGTRNFNASNSLFILILRLFSMIECCVFSSFFFLSISSLLYADDLLLFFACLMGGFGLSLLFPAVLLFAELMSVSSGSGMSVYRVIGEMEGEWLKK